MIVVDSSALLAILLKGPDAALFANAVGAQDTVLISDLSVYETRVVVIRQHKSRHLGALDALLDAAQALRVPFDSAQADLATLAYQRYGRGSGHRARLNLADCAAYALATSRDLPLLYKGNGFAATDVRSARAEPSP
jgi:ribonuclease VapC